MFVLSEYIYFITSYFMLVEPFRLKEIQKKGLIKKKTRHILLISFNGRLNLIYLSLSYVE